MARSAEPSWPVRIGILALPIVALALAGAVASGAPAPPQRHVVASIGGHLYDLTVAETTEAQEQGLQGHPEPERCEGMLFDLHKPRDVTMLIKSLEYPIDVVFVGGDGLVQRTVSMQPWPMGIQTAPSGKPARYVVELRKGTFASEIVMPGDPFEIVAEVTD